MNSTSLSASASLPGLGGEGKQPQTCLADGDGRAQLTLAAAAACKPESEFTGLAYWVLDTEQKRPAPSEGISHIGLLGRLQTGKG